MQFNSILSVHIKALWGPNTKSQFPMNNIHIFIDYIYTAHKGQHISKTHLDDKQRKVTRQQQEVTLFTSPCMQCALHTSTLLSTILISHSR